MNRKNTSFVVSSGPDVDGYINFVNTGNVLHVAVHGEYLIMNNWDYYNCWFTFDTFDNAKAALDILLDELDQAKMNTPKKIIKLNELDGVVGTDGVMATDYNSDRPWTTSGGGGGGKL